MGRARSANVRAGCAVIASLLATSALAACGGGHKASGTPTPSAPNTPGASAVGRLSPAFIARANAVCAHAVTNEKFPYPSFDPTHPDVKLLPKVGAFFAKLQKTADGVPHDLRRLGAPPSGQATWNRILAVAQQLRSIADRQITAAKASDVPAFVSTVNEIGPVMQELGPLAAQAGFAASSPCQMTGF
jgi:hypothetical protein